MGEIVDHLEGKNLVPFKRRRNGYHLPILSKEAEKQLIDEVDPELRPEEQGYVRHYLAYADVMLKNAEEEEEPVPAQEASSSAETDKVTEMPKAIAEDEDEEEDFDAA